MTRKNFYNSDITLTLTAGAFAIIAAPAAFAGSELNLVGPVQESAIESMPRPAILPNKALFMNPPPQIPESNRNPSVTDILGRAFTREDLSGLYGAGGFGNCETSSRIPSFFEKNYSNFVASCLEEYKSRQAITFDERFRANPETEGIASSPIGGRVQWTNISAGARERLLQRSINDLAKKNKTLSDILQGRISFDFGLGQVFSNNKETSVKVQDARPRYVVEVIDPIPEKNGKNRSLVASIGKLPQGSVGKQGIWFAQKPSRARRTLKETFEPASGANSAESLIPANQPVVQTADAPQDPVSTLRYVSRLAGLSNLPFTKMNMRAERRVVENRNQFALRATESQDLFFAELPDVRNPSASSLVWGYKIPWKQHAVAIRIDEGAQEKTTTYSYKIDDSNRSEVNYNHKTNAVSAGFAVSF